MRFSELVVLGSTIVEFDPTVFLRDGCGCLIGMAGAAKSGLTSLPDGATWRLFPWLKAEVHAACPICGETYWNYSTSISCLAVHVKRRECSFEQALDYIRMIEPQEEESVEQKVSCAGARS